MIHIRNKQKQRELKIQLGHYLQEERQRQNLTQEKLAELLNVSPRQLRRYEKGTCFYPVSTLFKLVNLGFDIFYLSYGKEFWKYHLIRGMQKMPLEDLEELFNKAQQIEIEGNENILFKECFIPIIKYNMANQSSDPIREFPESGIELINKYLHITPY